MALVAHGSIWTADDRPCGRCGVHLARPDDWLCQECRGTLEADWGRLAHSITRPTAHPLRAEPRGSAPAQSQS